MTGIPQRLPLSSGDREGRLDRLKREEFDLVVIGGGINGAGIARDAAMRGFRVALVEKAILRAGPAASHRNSSTAESATCRWVISDSCARLAASEISFADAWPRT